MSKTTKNQLSEALVKEIKSRKRKSKQSAEDKASVKKTSEDVGWTRQTIYIREEHSEKLELLAYCTGLHVKYILEKIFDNFFRKKEIPSIPRLKQDEISKIFETDQEPSL